MFIIIFFCVALNANTDISALVSKCIAGTCLLHTIIDTPYTDAEQP